MIPLSFEPYNIRGTGRTPSPTELGCYVPCFLKGIILSDYCEVRFLSARLQY
jgi:hypothetical protein